MVNDEWEFYYKETCSICHEVGDDMDEIREESAGGNIAGKYFIIKWRHLKCESDKTRRFYARVEGQP